MSYACSSFTCWHSLFSIVIDYHSLGDWLVGQPWYMRLKYYKTMISVIKKRYICGWFWYKCCLLCICFRKQNVIMCHSQILLLFIFPKEHKTFMRSYAKKIYYQNSYLLSRLLIIKKFVDSLTFLNFYPLKN